MTVYDRETNVTIFMSTKSEYWKRNYYEYKLIQITVQFHIQNQCFCVEHGFINDWACR